MTRELQLLLDRITDITAKKGPVGLDRMKRYLELLGNPERDFKVFHVGGTNGKGSVTRYITSMLEAAGYRVGLYTSPHVLEYNERIYADGHSISDEAFVRIGDVALSFADQLSEEGYGYPSQFEMLTAIAYLYFYEENVDYVVLEVGLGGIIDSTNTIEHPIATVITQIGYDHTEILGDTLTEIAANKAGIIKSGVPVISESPELETISVLREYSLPKAAPLIDSSSYHYEILESEGGMLFNAEIYGERFPALRICMMGEHQVRNAIAAVTAVMAARELGLVNITEAEIREGLKTARVMGRFEILSENPYFIIDGAHNPSGVRTSVDTFRSAFNRYINEDGAFSGLKGLVVYGCFNDKPYEDMLDIIADGLRGLDFIATEPDYFRALPCEELRELMVERRLACTAVKDEEAAYEEAVSGGYDVVFILGSIYLIGDMRKLYTKKGWS